MRGDFTPDGLAQAYEDLDLAYHNAYQSDYLRDLAQDPIQVSINLLLLARQAPDPDTKETVNDDPK